MAKDDNSSQLAMRARLDYTEDYSEIAMVPCVVHHGTLHVPLTLVAPDSTKMVLRSVNVRGHGLIYNMATIEPSNPPIDTTPTAPPPPPRAG